MFILSWQITLVALILLPLFLVPARMVGRPAGRPEPGRATTSTPR